MKLLLRPLSIRTRLTLWYSVVLLAILLVMGTLSYSILRWSLIRDLDASLLTVAKFIHESGHEADDARPGSNPEVALQEILGPEFYDKVFQFVDATGAPAVRSTQLRHRTLPLTAMARTNAGRGLRTFETVKLSTGEPVRLLTMPIVRAGRAVQLLQVGIAYHRVQQELWRYLQTLLVLGPLGLGLAAGGGTAIARALLARVDEMSRTARRISAEDLGDRITVRGTSDELDHLADTLNAMLARLQATFVEIRRFTADAAHELRTPLTALTGEIEVALRADRAPEEYRDVLRSSLEEVKRLTRLAEDLLLLSRSAAGAGLARERVDLEALVMDVVDVGVRLAQPRHVVVHLDEIAPTTILGDALALRRAILNIVENAVKYTPAGGKVGVALSREKESVCIAVQDTGIGMGPSDVERIFQPFVRLDAARARDTGGAGLGLAITRSIVLAHGGTVAVESVIGAGSRFTIRLPLAQ
jgi:heavy metal sensor kinase